MPKILIIEDDRAICELYNYIFTDLGYKVETACDGEEGLKKASTLSPDCILLDIRMPGMSGVEFAEHFYNSSDPLMNNIPFVVLTGENNRDASIQCAFRGIKSCRAFLPKLTATQEVVRTVENILERRE